MDENKLNNSMENNNAENEESNENVNFGVQRELSTVTKPVDDKKKRFPAVIIICVLCAALIIGGVIYLAVSKMNGDGGKTNPDDDPHLELSSGEESSKSDLQDYIDGIIGEDIIDENGNVIDKDQYAQNVQQQVQEATTSLNENVGVTSPHVIDENKNTGNPGSNTAQNTEQVDKSQAQIKAFFNRQCYFRGAIYAGGEGNPIAMALDGNDMETLANFDGSEIAIVKLGDKLYFKRPALGMYMELSDVLTNITGLSASDLDFDLGVDYEAIQNNLTRTFDVTIDGKEGVGFEYENDASKFAFYTVDGEIKQIEIYDQDGNVGMQMTIDYFSEAIPSDQLNFKGYKEAGIFEMFADMIQAQ